MSIGKANKFAFYIKFADRINNLRTIDCFKYYKQIEKVKQTPKKYPRGGGKPLKQPLVAGMTAPKKK